MALAWAPRYRARMIAKTHQLGGPILAESPNHQAAPHKVNPKRKIYGKKYRGKSIGKWNIMNIYTSMDWFQAKSI